MRIRAAAAMAALSLCAAISAPAQAAAPPGQMVTVYGAGTQSCGSWLADRQTLKNSVELNWVLGFLTASEDFLGEMHVATLRHTDGNAVAAWVDKYCRENPLKNIADASSMLIVELAKPE